MIRVAFVGAVDSGKSSLLGQIMIMTENVPADRVMEARNAVASAWADRSWADRNSQAAPATALAWLVDGLRGERRLGATMDVAYRYLTLFGQRVVVQDCPGHAELAGAVFTGLSTADAVVMVIDASLGITHIAKWHLRMIRMLQPRLVILAVNKMDLRDWSTAVVSELGDQARQLLGGVGEIAVMPVSAITGQGVEELVKVIADTPQPPPGLLRAVVQHVVRKEAHDLVFATEVGGHLDGHQFIRATTGTRMSSHDVGLVSGADRAIRVELSGSTEHLRRGTILSDPGTPPPWRSSTLTGALVWLRSRAAHEQDRLLVRIGTEEVPGRTRGRLNFGQVTSGKVILDRTTAHDPYVVNRITGSARLIDPDTGRVVGAMTMEG